MNEKRDNLLHDINSGISSLVQAFELANDAMDKDHKILRRVLVLGKDRVEELVNNWEKYKEMTK